MTDESKVEIVVAAGDRRRTCGLSHLECSNKVSKLRIANVDEEGRFGGPERRIIQVAKALKKHDIDTHIVYPKLDSDRFAREISKAGVASSAMAITRLSKEKKILARYIVLFPTELLRLSSFFRREGFDIVHVNGSYQFKVALAARMARVPVVWHLNDTSMDRIVKAVCLKVAKYCASAFIVAGKRVRDYYSLDNQLNGKPCAAIHAPVDTEVFDPDKVESDEELDRVEKRRIVTVSGVSAVKGLEYFIEMASNLTSRYDDLAFFVAGATLTSQQKYHESIKRQISSTSLTDENLVFLGLVENVPSLLRSADICVFTSVAEASPSAIWEAMSMAKAVVTTDVGSVHEYIDDGVSGFIVPIRDAKALSEKVQFLLDHPDFRVQMGEKARIVARKKLDISITAEKHAEIYRRIASSLS